jgi:hypothetical protein
LLKKIVPLSSDGLSQGSFHEFGIDLLTRRIANHFAVGSIHDNRQTDPTNLGLDRCEITRPHDIGSFWMPNMLNRSFSQFFRILRMIARHG